MFEQLAIVFTTFAFPPLLCLICLVVVLATIGKSLGIRQKYVSKLLEIFEWGRDEVRRAREANAPQKQNMHNKTTMDGQGGLRVPTRVRCVSFTGDDEKIHEFELEEGEDFDGDDSSLAYTPRRTRPVERNLIKREASDRLTSKFKDPGAFLQRNRVATLADDSLDFVKAGVEAIIEDEVTSRFLAEDLAVWNMLTRTGGINRYQHITWRLTLLWMGGFLFRYCILFPTRTVLLWIGLLFLVISTAVIGYFPNGKFKDWANRRASFIAYRICSRAVSAVITYHNRENRPLRGGICVANHTSPIDAMVLACDNCYAMIGQRHGGGLGIVQRALSRATAHIWFERSAANDRGEVLRRIRAHVADERNLPILIFPEGTCINNTSVMMFKKGSFEVGVPIYPVAIKFDPRFGDPFWNSSQQNWTQYMLMMMTSWAIVADVWYLPKMEILPGEDAISFASRVKSAIAEQGGLIDMEWDGQLKRERVSDKMRARQQMLYSARLSQVTDSLSERDNTPDNIDEQLENNNDLVIDKIIETNNSVFDSPQKDEKANKVDMKKNE